MKYGIIGSMTGWEYDIPMTDIDGDGIYTGVCKDLKAGSYEFTVRADGMWDEYWGAYEENEDRTMNSQINCHITVKNTADLIVTIDTNGDDEIVWPVSYCTTEEINASKYSIIGSMTRWTADIPMYEYTDGKYVGMVKNVPAGQHEFRVRADGAWDDSWGVYEKEYDRTNCSQTTLSAVIDETSDILVLFDTTGDDYIIWPVSFAVITDNVLKSEQYAGKPAGQEPPVVPVEDTKYGVCGSMTDWGGYNDIPLYETETTGIYQGITPLLAAGRYEFKVRADKQWYDSWGAYDKNYEATHNSQNNVSVTLDSEAYIAVKFDTTGDDKTLWSVSYAVVTEPADEYEWVYAGAPDNILSRKLCYIGEQRFLMYETEDNVLIGHTLGYDTGTQQFKVYGDSFLRDFYNISENDYSFSVTIPQGNEYDYYYYFYARLDMSDSESPLSYAVAKDEGDDLEWIAITENDVATKFKDGMFEYLLKRDGTATLIKCSLENFEIWVTDKPKERDLVIPSEVNGYKVTTIGNYILLEDIWTDYLNVVISDGVTTIASKAFYDFTQLKSIVIPDSVTDIGQYAFSYCKNLKSVVLSKNITEIAAGVFEECTGLENINIPEGVASIGIGAFSECKKLKNINIPDSVTKIEYHAFSNCASLKSLVFSDNITELDITCIGGCSGLTDLTLNCSFANSYITYEYTIRTLKNLTNLTIGTGKQKVFLPWFGSSPKLKTVTLGDNANLGTVFAECENIENFFVSENNPNYSAENGILFNKTKTQLIRYPSARQGVFTIPENVNALFSSAFDNCKYLTEINIPENVADLGEYKKFDYGYYDYYSAYYPVFFNCIRLRSINVSENNPKYSSKNGILFNKEQTSIIRFPTTKRGSYTIPKNVTYLACGSFNKTKLSDITIHNDIEIYHNPDEFYAGVTYIDHVFSSNSGLIIKAEEGSPAHKYAKDCNIPCEFLFTNKSEVSAKRIVLGQSITVNANADYGDGNYTYAVYYKQSSGKKWTIKQDYSSNTSVQIKPSYAVNYDICVKAKDGTGKVSAKYFTVQVLNKLENTSYISSDAIFKGDSVYVYPSSAGGFYSGYEWNRNYQYSVLYKNASSQKWTVKNEYTYMNGYYYSCETIIPANAGDYDICVKVKDEAGTVEKRYFTVHVKKIEPLTNESTVSASNVTLGNTVTVNCRAKGEREYYEYQVLYKQASQSKWTTAQDFSTNDTVKFQPAKATKYDICVKVKGSSGTVVKKMMTVTVFNQLQNTSTISSTEIKKGESVEVKCSAKGGAGDYRYAVFYKQKSQTKWTVQQDFSENAAVSVKPSKATDYDICIKAEDKNNTVIKTYFTVTVV